MLGLFDFVVDGCSWRLMLCVCYLAVVGCRRGCGSLFVAAVRLCVCVCSVVCCCVVVCCLMSLLFFLC